MRCLAPDLPGMGSSGPSLTAGARKYKIVDHIDHVNEWIDRCISPDRKIILVLHDWGSAIGFHWASEHSNRVAGIAHMEVDCRFDFDQVRA